MDKLQVMAIAQAIALHEYEVFGDTCLITNLTRIIEDASKPFETPHKLKPTGDAARDRLVRERLGLRV